MERTTPALAQLMGAYFHQDWDEDGSEDDVVDLFVSEELSLAPLLLKEIDWVLATCADEHATADYVCSLGPDYDPTSVYGGYRPWLAAIAERTRQHSP